MQFFVLNTSIVFIHSLSEWSFGLSYVFEATFRAVNDVNQIASFACDLVFGRKIFTDKILFAKKSLYVVQFF